MSYTSVVTDGTIVNDVTVETSGTVDMNVTVASDCSY